MVVGREMPNALTWQSDSGSLLAAAKPPAMRTVLSAFAQWKAVTSIMATSSMRRLGSMRQCVQIEVRNEPPRRGAQASHYLAGLPWTKYGRQMTTFAGRDMP